MTKSKRPTRQSESGTAHPEEARSAAAAAHDAFADALGMLREFTGGASLLMVEWQLVQQLAQQAAQLFDDLPVCHADGLVIPHPRRWWEPPWTRGEPDAELRPGQFTLIDQVFLAGRVWVDDEADNAAEWGFFVDAYFLGRDAVLRNEGATFTYPRSEHPQPPLEVGLHGHEYSAWVDLDLGRHAEPLHDIGLVLTEHLLKSFAQLGASTRDVLRERIERVRAVGRLCTADGANRDETNPPLRA